MNKLIIHILLFHFWLAALLTPSIRAFSAEPVVHAVLFYSPNCGHCHLVITETILPLVEQYGEKLIIVGVDTTQPAGQVLFRTAVEHFKLETAGVPLLAIGDTYLYGSLDIPEKLPGMIEQYLAQGGVDWPDVPGLAEAMAAAENAQTPTPLPGTQTDPDAGSDNHFTGPSRRHTHFPRVNTGQRSGLQPVGTPEARSSWQWIVACGAGWDDPFVDRRSHFLPSLIRRAAWADLGLAHPCALRGWHGCCRLPGLRGNHPCRSRVRSGGRLQHRAAKRIRQAVWRAAYRRLGTGGLSS